MKIHFNKIITQSFGAIKNNAMFFIALVSLFVAANFALILLVQTLLIPSFWFILLIKVLILALYVKLAVTVHRSVLLSEVGQWRSVFSWRAYDSMFFVVSVAVYIATAISVFVLFFMFSFVFSDAVDYLTAAENEYHALLIYSFIGGAIFSKICLIYPSTAVGKELAIEESMDLTGGHFIQIFLLLCVMPLLISLLGVLFDFEQNALWVAFLMALITNLIVVFQITVLSHIYLQIAPEQSSKENNEISE